MKRIIILIIMTGTYLFLMGNYLRIFLADLYYTRSKNQLKKVDLANAEKSVTSALGLNSKEPAYFRQRAKVYLTQNTLNSFNGVSGVVADKVDNRDLAYEDLLLAQELNPKNLATLRNVVSLYYFLVTDLPAQPENNLEYALITQKYFNDLKYTYKNDLGIITDVAKYEKLLGHNEDYEKSYEMARMLRLDIVEWHEIYR